MNFANPTALLWASLAIPIVIFYILKIRLRRVPVSTIIFWRQIFEEKQPRSIWQHLRHLLSLLIQIALLLLLVFALTEPFFKWEVLEARRVVLVVDNSASMKATDAAPTRIDRALAEGRRAIAGLRFRDEMAIVTAASQPRVQCGLTGHQRTLRDALDAIPATDGPTRVKDAVELARRLLADQKNRKVIVLSDGCFDGAAELAAADDVQLVVVGLKTANVGITRFQVRRSLLDPVGYEILAEVKNFSDDPVECRLEMELDDDVVDVVPLKLEANGQWSQVFEKTSAAGGRLVAKLNHTDALAADNTAWALLPRREMQSVMLVTKGNLFLQKVFEANPLVRLALTSDPAAEPPPGTITVFHRTVPEKLPRGPIIVIEPGNGCDLWEVGDKLENPIVTKQDKDSPLMAHVRLDNVLMPEAHKLTPAEGVKMQPLATALTGDPLYFLIDRPEGRVLVLSVNLDMGDLPLRTAFPIMMTNSLGWFAGSKGELRESLAAGAVTEIELPGAATLGDGAGKTSTPSSEKSTSDRASESSKLGADATLVLRSPDGQTRPLPSGVAKTTIGPLDQCGVWRVERDEIAVASQKNPRASDSQPSTPNPQPLLEIACNLASRAESDLRPAEELTSSQRSLASAGFGGRPIWFYLIAVAWLLAAVEWFLYQRRWIS